MKKRLTVVSLFLVMVLCLTGCGSKPSTLVCKMKVSSVNVTITSKFSGNKVSEMGLNYSMNLSKYSDSTIKALEKQDYCSSVQKAISQFTLTNCTQKIENKELLVTSGIDLDKVKSSELAGSPEKTKAALEKQGYTCELN